MRTGDVRQGLFDGDWSGAAADSTRFAAVRISGQSGSAGARRQQTPRDPDAPSPPRLLLLLPLLLLLSHCCWLCLCRVVGTSSVLQAHPGREVLPLCRWRVRQRVRLLRAAVDTQRRGLQELLRHRIAEGPSPPHRRRKVPPRQLQVRPHRHVRPPPLVHAGSRAIAEVQAWYGHESADRHSCHTGCSARNCSRRAAWCRLQASPPTLGPVRACSPRPWRQRTSAI
jgi:hypothetical protein